MEGVLAFLGKKRKLENNRKVKYSFLFIYLLVKLLIKPKVRDGNQSVCFRYLTLIGRV